MKRIGRSGKFVLAGVSGLAMLLAALVLFGPGNKEANAFPIRPLCGPSYIWKCSGPGGDVTFFGTICDKFQYEQATGSTCVAG